MLTKDSRLQLVQLLYAYLFTLENDFEFDLADLKQTLAEAPSLIDPAALYRNHQEKVSQHLTGFGWAGTPMVSRAVLLASCYELLESKPENSDLQPKIISEYLHLTQSLAGAEHVALVHAVIGKLTNRWLPELAPTEETEDKKSDTADD